MSFYLTRCPESGNQYNLFNFCVKNSKNLPYLYTIENQQSLKWAGYTPENPCFDPNKYYVVARANDSTSKPPGTWYYVSYQKPNWKTPMYLTFDSRSHHLIPTTSSEAELKDVVLFQSKDYAERVCQTFKNGWEVKPFISHSQSSSLSLSSSS